MTLHFISFLTFVFLLLLWVHLLFQLRASQKTASKVESVGSGTFRRLSIGRLGYREHITKNLNTGMNSVYLYNTHLHATVKINLDSEFISNSRVKCYVFDVIVKSYCSNNMVEAELTVNALASESALSLRESPFLLCRVKAKGESFLAGDASNIFFQCFFLFFCFDP